MYVCVCVFLRIFMCMCVCVFVRKYVRLRFVCVCVCKVLWFVFGHINHCRSFNAKSFLYIYIKYIGFGLLISYGISTIVGHLMPNPFYTYILNI